ncbi:cobalt ABC transporter ATP-binding protein [Synergistales bacterium]|nr:cobalt ABC transporter ATP-binding protein [Synergistales bacterium]
MLIVRNLCASYPDGKAAINGVSLTIDDGERVALIGANGAGKSTLMRSIMGLMPAMSGSIEADGVTLAQNTAREIRKKVGIVFQNPDDQLFMTRVFDDVAFGPRNFGLSEDEVKEKVDSVLSQMNIVHLRDRVSDRLSSGEKRVAGIASVLVMRPATLLLDEPSSFLDPRARRTLIKTLLSLPHAMLIATHDLGFARRLCSRVIVLQNGQISAEGTPDEILGDEKKLEDYGL